MMATHDLTAEFGGFDVMVDGTSIAMQIEELGLPEIERKTESSRPGGSVGAIKSQHGLADDLKLTLKTRGYARDLEHMGSARGLGAVSVIARGSFTDKRTGEAFTNELTMRGRVNKWHRHGTYKQGDEIEATFELDLVFYEERREGRTLTLIDLLAAPGQFIIGGVNQAPGLKALFG